MPLLNLSFLLLLSRIWVLLLSRIWGVFIIKLQLIKLKNKKKGCYHLVRMKASGLGKVSSVNVTETFSPLLVNSLERLLNLPGNTLFSQEYQRERISVSLSV